MPQRVNELDQVILSRQFSKIIHGMCLCTKHCSTFREDKSKIELMIFRILLDQILKWISAFHLEGDRLGRGLHSEFLMQITYHIIPMYLIDDISISHRLRKILSPPYLRFASPSGISNDSLKSEEPETCDRSVSTHILVVSAVI